MALEQDYKNSRIAKQVFAALEACLANVQQMRHTTDNEHLRLQSISNDIWSAEGRLSYFMRDDDGSA